MANKIDSILGSNQSVPAQGNGVKAPKASQVGRILSNAVNLVIAKAAGRRPVQGGGRLNSKVKAKSVISESDHEEEEVFHGAIDPIEKGHDAHEDRQPHPEVPIQLNILPEKKTEKTSEEDPKKAENPFSSSHEKYHEKSTVSLIWKSLVATAQSKEHSVYSKIHKVPILALGIFVKKTYDFSLVIPRRIVKPILRSVIRPGLLWVFKKFGLKTELEFLKFKKNPLQLSNNYKVAFFISRIAWTLPSLILSGLWYGGSKIFKNKHKVEPPKKTLTLAEQKAIRQEEIRKQNEERKIRLARQQRVST